MNYFYKITSLLKSYKYFLNINYEQKFEIEQQESEQNDSSDLSDSDLFDSDLSNENNENNEIKEYINNNKNIYDNFIPLSIKLISYEPINIIDGIFIGNIYSASNWSYITSYDFKYIINFNIKIENPYPNEKNINFITKKLDKKLENIDEILQFINKIQTKTDITRTNLTKSKNNNDNNNTNILLLSLAGNNTICIIMIAYLIYFYNFNFNKALLFICKKIPNYNINKKYFNIIKKKYT